MAQTVKPQLLLVIVGCVVLTLVKVTISTTLRCRDKGCNIRGTRFDNAVATMSDGRMAISQG